MEAVKRYFAVRNDEIRAIVAAVEWTELLVPFSELIGQTEICVKGIKLYVDWEVNSITATPVQILAMNNGRYLAPWHELNLYIDEESLHKGIISYEKWLVPFVSSAILSQSAAQPTFKLSNKHKRTPAIRLFTSNHLL